MTEKEKFFKNLAKKREGGLIGIKLTPNYEKIKEGVNEEELYAELNRMDEAPTVSDDELFPNI